MAAVTVPPMAKVTPPIKRDTLPVIDPQLSICYTKVLPSSKVPPLISVFVDVLSDVVTSFRALHGVGTVLLSSW